ncbi:AsmA family protein [Marinobacter caseinilyticus]|uniref:AsmA family protein n=1 Tax=Marinobacter caseinilyticus TaxID=2692195 RepID=UPI0014097E35|nr:AsmA family protein [Marinobacter caseinilyticus]
MKAVRNIVLALFGLMVFAVVAVGVAILVIDPNTYKPQIEQVVEDNTNLDLILAGNIGWSFIPLGLELNNVEATLDGERLVKLDQLIAQVNFWSLITMSPQVDTFVLDGLDARLSVAKNGTGNWTRVMPEPAGEANATEQAAEAQPETAPTDDAEPTASAPLNFNVEDVRITNAQVHYDDLSSGQSITLEDFSLAASQIKLGQQFPLELAFRFSTGEPAFAVDGRINAQLAANEALSEFEVSGLDSQFELSGKPFGEKTVQTRLTGAIKANLENQTAMLTNLRATLANLELNTNLSVSGFGDQPTISGDLKIPEFSLKQLLSNLGQAEIETDDPDVLNALGFSTSIGGPSGKLELSSLIIKVDDTTFNGMASYGLANQAIGLKLTGDSFNADRYLPPTSEEDTAPSSAEPSKTSAAGQTEEGDLLPLQTLRELALDINLGLSELVVSNLTINDIKSVITANNGILKLSEFSGKLYDGSFTTNATLDARTDNPAWVIGSKVTNVKTLPMLKDLAELDLLSGAANINIDVKTQGNRVSVLREKANGEINFNLAEGQFTRMNITRMACQGIALANGESLSTSDWGTSTPFNDMKGTLKIDGNTLNNTDLVAALAGMELRGDGSVDLKASDLNYEIGLRVVGEVHRDNACRVTDYVKGAVIPVECRGNFSEDPAKLCSFDGSRFRDTLKTMAANAARKKAEEKIDKAIDEKVGKKLEEKLGSESGDKVKDALKGLFK